MVGKQLELFIETELAAEMYVDGLVDGQGQLLTSLEGLRVAEKSVTLDSLRSVSGLIRSDPSSEIDGCDGGEDRLPSPFRFPLPF